MKHRERLTAESLFAEIKTKMVMKIYGFSRFGAENWIAVRRAHLQNPAKPGSPRKGAANG